LDALFIFEPVDCVNYREAFMGLGFWLFVGAGVVIVIGLIVWQFKL